MKIGAILVTYSGRSQVLMYIVTNSLSEND